MSFFSFQKRNSRKKHQQSKSCERTKFLSLLSYGLGFLGCLKYNLEQADGVLSDHYIKSILQHYKVDDSELISLKDDFKSGVSDAKYAQKTHGVSNQKYLDLSTTNKKISEYKYDVRLSSHHVYSNKQCLTKWIDFVKYKDSDKRSLMKPALKKILTSFATELNISQVIYQQLYDLSDPNNGDQSNINGAYSQAYLDACLELGVEADSEFAMIKKAYQKLMNRYHPDKLASQNLSPNQLAKTTQLTQTYQKAYKTIRNYHR